jgi:hypothetical protein
VTDQRRGKRRTDQKNEKNPIVPSTSEPRRCHQQNQFDSGYVPDCRGEQVPENSRDTHAAIDRFSIDLRDLHKKVYENPQ